MFALSDGPEQSMTNGLLRSINNRIEVDEPQIIPEIKKTPIQGRQIQNTINQSETKSATLLNEQKDIKNKFNDVIYELDTKGVPKDICQAIFNSNKDE